MIPTANESILEASLVRVLSGEDPLAMARDVDGGSHRRAVLLDAESLGYAARDLEMACCDKASSRNAADGRGPRLWVDSAAPGDIMCPLGMHGRTKKVSDILGAARIPVAERSLVPVVRTAPAGTIVWVAGVRLDERFKCTPATRFAIKLGMRRVV